MKTYRVCQAVWASDIPLPELPATDTNPQCRFRLSTQASNCAGLRWVQHWRFPDGQLWLSFARRGSEYFLRFPELADFVLSRDGRDVVCFPQNHIPVETLRHLFLDQVVPLAMTASGGTVLHASGVALPQGCVAFAGSAGEGKSTMAALLARQGFPLVADDCLLLGGTEHGFTVVPSYPGVRLWESSISALIEPPTALVNVAHYSQKKRVDAFAFAACPAPLRRVYLLSPADDGPAVALERIASRDIFLELFKNSFRLDVTDRARVRHESQVLARVVEAGYCRRLRFRKDFSVLNEIARAVLDDAGQ